MALTLAESEKLSNDVLLQGVIETIIKDSPVLQTLPFIQIVGNGLTYPGEDHAYRGLLRCRGRLGGIHP